jgi:hypothetical protein
VPLSEEITPMGKRVAILQSNYIPWKGYFDLINSVDEFILYDTAQFTKNDWRNRNKIKTSGGLLWLSIPVRHRFGQLIQDTTIRDSTWNRTHWRSLSQAYAKAAYFKMYKSTFEELYNKCGVESKLSNVNFQFIKEVCAIIGIKTSITWSRDYRLVDGQTERLVDLCKQLGASEYLSGPVAKNYIESDLFAQENIKLTYIDYSGYPEYPQLFPPFEHGVSILDLIFNTGPEARMYMKNFRGLDACKSPAVER